MVAGRVGLDGPVEGMVLVQLRTLDCGSSRSC